MAELAEYEAWLWETGASERTVNLRTVFARRRFQEWPHLAVTPDVVARWLARFTGWTRYTYHSHLRSLFAWAVETGRVDRDPTARIPKPAPPRPRPNPLTSDEVDRILAEATGDVRLWIRLGLLAGLRVHEIARMRAEEFDSTGLYVVGKGGQVAMVPMHPDLWADLRGRQQPGWLFRSPVRPADPIPPGGIQYRVTGLFRSVGVAGGIHRTRATYGTNLLRDGANIRVVQRLMRHASLTSTEHYLAAADDELANAIRRLAA